MDDEVPVEHKNRKFANGDEYVGGWRDGYPEGHGKYLWKDGSSYEGGWKEGTKHGVGRYVWPSGATYHGEWLNGCMHGIGTFDAPDGSKYQGGWVKDLKHGLGKKTYANGDKYEGLWKNGKPEGPGRYMWADGNEYDGEWKNGKMHGQGTFVWKTGERYDGEWKDGQEDGIGVFTFREGSTYDGLWRSGKKHGIGVYRPMPLDNKRATAPVGSQGSEGSMQPEGSEETASTEGPVSAPGAGRRTVITPPVGDTSKTNETVFVREYDRGKMAREWGIAAEDLEQLFGSWHFPEPKGKVRRLLKGEAKQVKRLGEIIVKGQRSYDLMLNLQLGIRFSVSKANVESARRELCQDDFSHRVKQNFPREGTPMTPVHPSNDFKWKDYCPLVFRQLRDLWGVDTSDYMLSLCGDQALRQLNSPGKSGSVFFLSHDDKYFIKTMRKSEMKLLFELLPKYYQHVCTYPHTLVTKFFGLHRVKPYNGRKVRFVVMANMFRTDLLLHRKYDLKGSTVGRCSPANKLEDPNTTLKDLDLDLGFKLEEGWHDRLMQQIKADCVLLESLRVMDYSLLLGVHFRGRQEEEADRQHVNFNEYTGEEDLHRELRKVEERILRSGLEEGKRRDLLELAQLKMLGGRGRSSERSPTMVLAMRPKRSETLRPVAHTEGATDDLAQSLGQTRVQLGINMAATAVPSDGNSTAPPQDVVLYFGIIDILQEYNASKKVEHAFKSLTHDGQTISSVDPRFYARRFQQYLRKVFV